MLIDIYTHIFPGDFFTQMVKAAPRLENIGKRMKSVTMIHDLDQRFRLMDQFGDYGQVISLPNPPNWSMPHRSNKPKAPLAAALRAYSRSPGPVIPNMS